MSVRGVLTDAFASVRLDLTGGATVVRITPASLTDAEKKAINEIGDAIRAATKGLPILAACRVLLYFQEWEMDEYVATWVGEARREGHSWQEIGDALGVTRQSVWERWAKTEAEVAIEDAEFAAESAEYDLEVAAREFGAVDNPPEE